MDSTTKIIILVIYLIAMALFYLFMLKRLSYLNKKHIDHTHVDKLNKNHNSLIRNITIVWGAAMIISSVLILTI